MPEVRPVGPSFPVRPFLDNVENPLLTREYVLDAVLLRPDFAIIATNRVIQGEVRSRFGYYINPDIQSDVYLHLVNPISGHLHKRVKLSLGQHQSAEFWFTRIDDKSAAIHGRQLYDNNDGNLAQPSRLNWFTGTVTDSGHVTFGIVPYQSPDGPILDFVHSKQDLYNFYNPHTRTVTFQDWVTYFDWRSHGRASVCYGTSISVDTHQIVKQYRIYAAQSESVLQYYESLPFDLDGYEGGLGVEPNSGTGDDGFSRNMPMKKLWLTNGARKRLVGLPFPKFGNYLNEAWIQQCADDLDCASIVYNVYPGVEGDDDSNETRALVVRLYPSFKVVRGPLIVGRSFGRNTQHVVSPLQQGLSFNFFDQPRISGKNFMAQGLWSTFGISYFYTVDSAGIFAAFRHYSEPRGLWEIYTVPRPVGMEMSGRSQDSDGRVTQFGDYALIFGGDQYMDTHYPPYYQLVKVTPRTGHGNASPRTVAFT